MIWFVATRRFRAAAISAASGALMIVLSWAVIGFKGVGRYPQLLDELTSLRLDVSHSVASIAMGLGASRSVGTMIALLVGGALAVAAVRAGRRGEDAACLMLALSAGLAIIPIVWQHHLLVLVVPLAVAAAKALVGLVPDAPTVGVHDLGLRDALEPGDPHAVRRGHRVRGRGSEPPARHPAATGDRMTTVRLRRSAPACGTRGCARRSSPHSSRSPRRPGGSACGAPGARLRRRPFVPPAAHAVLDGASPYAAPGDFSISSETAYVYPPLFAELLSPLAFLSTGWAAFAATAASLALLGAAIWLTGLRDPVCYGVVALWAPTFNALQCANASVLITFLVALAWRFRDSSGVGRPLTEGLAIAIKPFAWPLVVWEAARGRWRTAAAAVGLAALLVALAWVPLRFAGFGRFFGLNDEVAAIESGRSYSIGGVIEAAGWGRTAGLAVALGLGAALLVACLIVGRRGDEAGSLALALAAALVLTPVVWQHYLVVLVVPLAAAKPRMSAVWLLPVALWLAPTNGNGAWWQTPLVGVAAADPRRRNGLAASVPDRAGHGMRRLDRYSAPAIDVMLVAAVAVVAVAFVYWLEHGVVFAVDFRSAYLPAADAVRHGVNPFPAATDPSVDAGSAYVYPPLLALVLVPFTALPELLASVLWVLLLVGALGAMLALCGVRDWRCYAAVAIWAPTATAVQTANVSIPLGLLAALAWRYRDRFGSAAAVGGALGLKLALGPLLVWLWFRGSARRALQSLAVAAILILVPWALIGFAGVGGYVELTRELSRLESPESFTVYAMALAVGLPEWLSQAIWLGVAGVLVVASAVAGRRGADQQSFVLALFAALAMTPIVWLHTYVLLAVPLAVARPRFGAAWLIPLLMWGAPVTDGNGVETARVLVTLALVLGACLRPAGQAQGARRVSTAMLSPE